MICENASLTHQNGINQLRCLQCRAVLPERPLYPAFAPDNFETVQTASRKASELAQQALKADGESAIARRDAAFAKAAVLRWPDESAFGPKRDEAEKLYSHALQEFGRRVSSSLVLHSRQLNIFADWLVIVTCQRQSSIHI